MLGRGGARSRAAVLAFSVAMAWAPPAGAAIVAAVLRDASGGHLVPFDEFRLTGVGEPNCNPSHFHARNGVDVFSLDQVRFPDPAPTACGYGLWLPFVGVYTHVAGDSDGDGLLDGVDPAPFSHDADGDGTPDPLEDTDGDTLSDAEEINVHGTNINSADSDGDGISDMVDVVIAQTAEDFTVVPVLVNILAGAGPVGGPDPAETLRDGVEQANVILKQAKIKLVPIVKVLTAAESMAFDSNGDGRIEQLPLVADEATAAQNTGSMEVDKLPGKKGVKLIVAREVGLQSFGGFQDQGGLSRKGERGILISMNPQGSPTDENKLGLIIAHEICHVFGFPHSDETPDATPEELAPTNLLSSDDPAVAAARLMFVMTNGVGGITLSERQIGVIAGSKDLGAFGFKGTKKSPGRLVAQEFGILGDALGDTLEADALDHLDLVNARLSADSSAETIDVALDLSGLFPAADPIDLTYRVRLDSDANPTTGSAGFDRHLDFRVIREQTGAPLRLGLSLSLPPVPFGEPLETPVLELVSLLSQTGANEVVAARLRARVPKSVLALSALQVPVLVEAHDGPAGLSTVQDVIGPFVFERDFSEDLPTLELTQEFVSPGDSLPYTLAGLAPNAAFELQIDSTTVQTGQLDAAGGHFGALTWPPGLPPGFYFLTARDETGAIAFNAVEAVTLAGDLDFDGDLDEGDRLLLLAAFGLLSDDPNFPPAADLDGDGRITFVDYQRWVELFRAANPPPPPSCGLLGPEVVVILVLLLGARRMRSRGRGGVA